MDVDNSDGTPIGGDLPLMPPPPPPPPVSPRRGVVSRRAATAALAGGLVVGGIAGGYVISQAASSPAASTSPSPSAGSVTAPDGHANPGGKAAQDEDLSQAAAAIGITSTQLQTELTAGKTIAAVATEHNVTVATVISTLTADENKEIDAAVTSGKLTAAQATAEKAQTTQRVTDMVNGTKPAGGPGGPGRGGSAEDQQVIADALKLTTTQVATEEAAGKTIAAIANEHSIDPATVIAALAASEDKEIDALVTASKLTAAQAATEKAQTTQRATDEVNGTEPARGSGDPGGRGHGGPPPGGATAAPTS